MIMEMDELGSDSKGIHRFDHHLAIEPITNRVDYGVYSGPIDRKQCYIAKFRSLSDRPQTCSLAQFDDKWSDFAILSVFCEDQLVLGP